jgi:uncharacterized membrane protein
LAVFLFARKVLWPAFVLEDLPLPARGNDFAAYYMGAWEMAQNHSPYHGVTITDRVGYHLGDEGRWVLSVSAEVIPGYVYPPPLALLLRPMLSMKFQEALRLWLALNVLLAGACLAICLELFTPAGQRQIVAGVTAVIFLASMPTQECLLLGQINYLVMFLCLSAYVAMERNRPFHAGGLLAGAAWLKVTPVFLLIYFLLHQRRRRFLWGFLATGAVIGVWVLLRLGLAETWHYFTQILPAAGQGQLAISNKSFLAILARLFTPNPLMAPVADLPWAGRFFQAIFVAGALYLFFRLRRQERNDVALSEARRERRLFAAALVLMLLCQPLLQIHHLIFAFPALLAAFTKILARRHIVAGLAFVVGLLLLNSRGWNAFAHWSAHWSSVFLIAPQAWGLLIVVGLLFLKYAESWKHGQSPMQTAQVFRSRNWNGSQKFF